MIHHRDMFGEHKAVGARDRNIRRLERADDGFEQSAALAHQHDDVARLHSLADPDRGMPRDLARQPHLRARFARGVERGIPSFDVLPVLGQHQRPDIDNARHGIGQGFMHGAGGIARKSRMRAADF